MSKRQKIATKIRKTKLPNKRAQLIDRSPGFRWILVRGRTTSLPARLAPSLHLFSRPHRIDCDHICQCSRSFYQLRDQGTNIPVGSFQSIRDGSSRYLNVQKLSDPISFFHATAGTMAGNAGRPSDDDRRRSDDQVRRGFHERFPGGAQGPPRKWCRQWGRQTERIYQYGTRKYQYSLSMHVFVSYVQGPIKPKRGTGPSIHSVLPLLYCQQKHFPYLTMHT